MINEYFILVVIIEVIIIFNLLNNWFKGTDMNYFNIPTKKDIEFVEFIGKVCKKVFFKNPIFALLIYSHLINVYVKIKYCKKIF